MSPAEETNLWCLILAASPGQITLGVDQQAVEEAPTFSNPKAAPDDELQRSTREHYGYG